MGIVWDVIPARLALLLALLLALPAPAAAQATVATGVAADATAAASQPKIARQAAGTVSLTFVKPVGGGDQIHVATSTDDGRTWRVQQVTRAGAPSRYPTLAAGPDGSLHLAWTQYEPTGHVYYARFDGTRWSAPLKISPGSDYAGVPAIAVDSRGDPHVVWYGIREQAPQVRTRHGSIYEIVYRGRAGGRWSTPVVISPGIPDAINPALAVDGQDRLHSAWYQFDIQVYQVMYARRERAWRPPQQVSAGQADAFAVALAVRRDGTAYVVWERRAPGGARIYFAQRRDGWSGQQPVSPAGPAAGSPTVAVDDRGRVSVAWQSEGQLSLRRRDGRWGGTDRITSEGVNAHPVLAASRDGVDLMWTQEVAGVRRVRFAALSEPAPARGGALPAALLLLALAATLLWRWRRLRVTGS